MKVLKFQWGLKVGAFLTLVFEIFFIVWPLAPSSSHSGSSVVKGRVEVWLEGIECKWEENLLQFLKIRFFPGKLASSPSHLSLEFTGKTTVYENLLKLYHFLDQTLNWSLITKYLCNELIEQGKWVFLDDFRTLWETDMPLVHHKSFHLPTWPLTIISQLKVCSLA